jgi:hypothetical protein
VAAVRAARIAYGGKRVRIFFEVHSPLPLLRGSRGSRGDLLAPTMAAPTKTAIRNSQFIYSGLAESLVAVKSRPLG